MKYGHLITSISKLNIAGAGEIWNTRSYLSSSTELILEYPESWTEVL